MAEKNLGEEHLNGKIIPIAIEDEMQTAYIDYAMSVIISRALPDARDGLKPSQRRIIYAMERLNLFPGAKHRKCAKICGDTSGDFHPHGETIIYPTLVRMAPDWLMRYPLIDGQGNFGSIDGDSAAAMRYTEARLTKAGALLLDDLDKETVDFAPNYDATKKEPLVFPGKFPNLLVNGSSGIAVGMATNIPPHNLLEVIAAIHAYIDDPAVDIDTLIEHIKAPDFPTGGIIHGYQGARDAYHTGRGRIIIRARAAIETDEGRTQIIVTEIPYMVNKATMIEKTAHLINEKKLEGIADLRDESDKDGLRVVYDLKKDAIANVVLNNLYKKTSLQTSFSVNSVALINGKPRTLTIKDFIKCYVDHRHEVITRKTTYEHKQASHKLHLLEGYLTVLNNLDPIIKLIKEAQNPDIAKQALKTQYTLSDLQAKAILEMRLQRLTGMEREKILQENKKVKALIAHLEAILADESMRMDLIKEDLKVMKEKYAAPRKTEIVYQGEELTIEDMIPNEQMVITISRQGYVKRSPLTAYKTQNRGGIGAKGAASKKEDFTKHLFIAATHDYLLIFTDSGSIYWKRVYSLPEGGKNTQGRAIQNLINITTEDKIRSIVKVENLHDEAYVKDKYIVFCTEKGTVKKTPLSAYTRPRTKGIRAILIQEGDRLLEAKLTTGENHLLIALRSGKAIRFPEKEVRPMGRSSRGVQGIRLADQHDRVIGMASVEPDEKSALLVISEYGYGKRSSTADYRITHRAGKGIKTLEITPKTGALVAMKTVRTGDELIIITSAGTALRTDLKSLRLLKRATQGVRILRLRKGDEIAAVDIISGQNQELL